MSSPRDVADELERAAGIGHVGTMVYGRSGDLLLDDPVYDDFFAAAARAPATGLHPSAAAIAGRSRRVLPRLRRHDRPCPRHLRMGVAPRRRTGGAAADHSEATFDRHPDLQVVLGHWGEMLLFWLDRANSLSRIAGLQRSVSDYMRSNFFITTSGMLNPALLHHALSVTSVDRLIFSTDYPFQHPTREDISSFLEHFTSDEEHEMFTSANAAALFGIELTPRLVRS